MKTILEVRITPFPSFSFLKDPVRHDESLVLVRRDEEVRNMFDLFIELTELVILIVLKLLGILTVSTVFGIFMVFNDDIFMGASEL